METKKKIVLRSSLFFSVLLHSFLLLVLSISAYTYTTRLSSSGSNGLHAVMLDPAIMSQQQTRLVAQQRALQQRDAERATQAKARAALVEKQRQLEQQQLKEIETKRLAALKAQQSQIAAAKAAAQKAQQELIKQQQQIALAKKQAQVEKQRALAEQARARAAAAQQANARQAAAILGDLSSQPPTTNDRVSGTEFNRFVAAVQQAISSQFRNPGIYNGQSCTLQINIAADGMLLNVSSADENSALCREAKLAVQQAKLPRPMSSALFEKVKNLTIDFKPGQD